MGRRQNDSELVSRFAYLILFVMALVSCSMVYSYLSRGISNRNRFFKAIKNFDIDPDHREEGGDRRAADCCKGVDHLELWGDAVRWGSEFKVGSSEECCRACKEMCTGEAGRECGCDSWVFCGDREACGSRFGECWLKKQKDTLNPERRESGNHVMWTSGLIFGDKEGIVGLRTDYGILRVKLFPECSPLSVNYILEILALRHCAGCHFYRAESLGSLWDSEGNHIKNEPFGPPFALIQGTLEAHGTTFENIERENCPVIGRGSVAWVGSGPDFFISLANHEEWRDDYTVFGSVLPEDMEVAELIAELPTRKDVWSDISVSVLHEPVSLRVQRVTSNTNTHVNLEKSNF